MELIQIDTIKWTSTSYITTQIYSLPAAVFVDAETGVVYFNGMYPRYDANGRVMVIPRDQLPAIIARGRAQAAAAAADQGAKAHHHPALTLTPGVQHPGKTWLFL